LMLFLVRRKLCVSSNTTESSVVTAAAWRHIIQGAPSHTRTLYPIFVINCSLVYYFKYNNTLKLQHDSGMC
jgi:hypothetical protein